MTVKKKRKLSSYKVKEEDIILLREYIEKLEKEIKEQDDKY